MPDGTLEPVRCGASNRCSYCAMYAALEAALVLKIDAELLCPTVGLTTTTRDPDFTMDDLRKAEQALWRQLRRELDPLKVDYVAFLEWTTGKGSHAGGRRRPHLHHLVKGIPADHELLEPVAREDGTDTNVLRERVSELWKRYTGDAWIVDVRPLRTPVGAIAYLALHHHKRCQAPPAGFTGRRLRPSKGYYEQPIAELRTLARKLLRSDHVFGAAQRAIGITLLGETAPDEFEADAQLTSAIAAGLRDMAERPLELQLDLEGNVDFDRERRELVLRTVDALARIRAEAPPELVRVIEKQQVDEQTGLFHRVAVAVLGPVEMKGTPWRSIVGAAA